MSMPLRVAVSSLPVSSAEIRYASPIAWLLPAMLARACSTTSNTFVRVCRAGLRDLGDGLLLLLGRQLLELLFRNRPHIGPLEKLQGQTLLLRSLPRRRRRFELPERRDESLDRFVLILRRHLIELLLRDDGVHGGRPGLFRPRCPGSRRGDRRRRLPRILLRRGCPWTSTSR